MFFARTFFGLRSQMPLRWDVGHYWTIENFNLKSWIELQSSSLQLKSSPLMIILARSPWCTWADPKRFKDFLYFRLKNAFECYRYGSNGAPTERAGYRRSYCWTNEVDPSITGDTDDSQDTTGIPTRDSLERNCLVGTVRIPHSSRFLLAAPSVHYSV